MHSFFIKIRNQSKIRDNDRRTLQSFKTKECIADDVFPCLRVRGKDNGMAADVVSMGDALFWAPSPKGQHRNITWLEATAQQPIDFFFNLF